MNEYTGKNEQAIALLAREFLYVDGSGIASLNIRCYCRVKDLGNLVDFPAQGYVARHLFIILMSHYSL